MIYDFVGIGFGPANIALAIAVQESGVPVTLQFLERQRSSTWQSGMLLNGTDIQHNPLRDLVTLRNPCSRFTFINFLKEDNRLIDYLNLGLDYPFRKDYSDYVSWAASQFDNVHFGSTVSGIEIIRQRDGTHAFDISVEGRPPIRARGMVLGHGRKPNIPTAFRTEIGPRVFHFTEYLHRIDSVLTDPGVKRIAVIGGGQSAIEICLDLRHRSKNTRVINILRPYGYRLRETSPFTRRIFMPDSPDYFYSLDHEARQRLRQDLHHTNYSVADAASLRELNCALYEDDLCGTPRISLEPRSEVRAVRRENGGFRITIVERYTGGIKEIDADAVILATGFRNLGNGPNDDRFPAILDTISEAFETDVNGVVEIQRDYSLKYRHPLPGLRRCFLNGLCEYSHGLSDSGTFSTLSYRSTVLADAIRQDRPQ